MYEELNFQSEGRFYKITVGNYFGLVTVRCDELINEYVCTAAYLPMMTLNDATELAEAIIRVSRETK